MRNRTGRGLRARFYPTVKLARGPRPNTIRIFAAGKTLLALRALVLNAMQMDSTFIIGGIYLLDPVADRTLIAIYVGAMASIALIPVALIWFYAANFARWFLLVMALLSLPGVLMAYPELIRIGAISMVELVVLLAGYALLALLFTPSAARWLKRKEEARNAAAFD